MFKTYDIGNVVDSDIFDGNSDYTTIEQLSVLDYNHAVDLGRPIKNLYENEYEIFKNFDSINKHIFSYQEGVISGGFGRNFALDLTDPSIDVIYAEMQIDSNPSNNLDQYYLRMPTGVAVSYDGTFVFNRPRTDILERQLFKILQMRDLDREKVEIKYDVSTNKFIAKVSKLLIVNAVSVTETLQEIYFGCADEGEFTTPVYTGGYDSSIKLLEALNNYNTLFNFKLYFISSLGATLDLSKLVCEPVAKIAPSNTTYYWKIDTDGSFIMSADIATSNQITIAHITVSPTGVVSSGVDEREYFGTTAIKIGTDCTNTTIDVFTGATTYNFGKSGSTTTLKTNTGSTTVDLFNTVATTMNLGGAATTINMGAVGATTVFNFNSTKDATNTTTGSLVIDGGVAIAKKVYAGDTLNIIKTGTAKTSASFLTLENTVNAADMDGTETSILFTQYYNDGSPAAVNSGRISIGTETDWTATASTQDSYMSLSTTLNGTLGEKVRINSNGYMGIGTTNPIRQLVISANGSSEFVLQDTGEASDQKNVRMYSTGRNIVFGTLDDLGNTGTDYLTLNFATQNMSFTKTNTSSTAQSSYDGVSFTANKTGNITSGTNDVFAALGVMADRDDGSVSISGSMATYGINVTTNNSSAKIGGTYGISSYLTRDGTVTAGTGEGAQGIRSIVTRTNTVESGSGNIYDYGIYCSVTGQDLNNQRAVGGEFASSVGARERASYSWGVSASATYGVQAYGIQASAASAVTNVGGQFAGGSGTTNYGVYTSATTGGTTNYGIYAAASGASTNYAAYFSGDTTTTGEATAASFKTSSLRSLKTDIVPYTEKALDLINQVNVVKFKYKENLEQEHIGFIADDTPNQLTGNKKDSMMMSDNIGVLIKAVQELNERIKALEAK